MITNVSTSPAVTQVGDYVFRTCFTDTYQGHIAARFARRDLGARSAVILFDGEEEYGVSLARSFRMEFEAQGGRLQSQRAYQSRGAITVWSLAEVGRLRPDVVFIPGHHESAAIMCGMQDLGITSVPLGGDGWETPGFDREGGRRVRHAYYVTHWSKLSGDAATKRFVAAFGDGPLTIPPAALALDAVGFLTAAVERARSVEGPALRAALAAGVAVRGVTGEMRLDASRDPVDKGAVVMEIVQGEPRFLRREYSVAAGMAPGAAGPDLLPAGEV